MSKLTLAFKDRPIKTYVIRDGDMVIGSDPSCDIHIDSMAVQAKHAIVTTQNNKSVLKDLGSAEGMYIAGQKVNEQELKDDDIIHIGKHTLQYDFFERHSTEDAGFSVHKEKLKDGWLQLMSGNNVGKTISLKRNVTNLGKPGIQTAVITKRADGYFLSHLEGKSYPEVDSKSIGDHSWKLEDGQVITIGNVKMLFYLS